MPEPHTPLSPIHPAEVLKTDFPHPLGPSANAFAPRTGPPGNRVSAIVAGRRAVTGDTALRLAAAFGTTPEFWMALQTEWELARARDGFEGGVERVA